MSFIAIKLLTFAVLLALIPVIGWYASSMDRSPSLWMLVSIFVSPIFAALGLVAGGDGSS